MDRQSIKPRNFRVVVIVKSINASSNTVRAEVLATVLNIPQRQGRLLEVVMSRGVNAVGRSQMGNGKVKSKANASVREVNNTNMRKSTTDESTAGSTRKVTTMTMMMTTIGKRKKGRDEKRRRRRNVRGERRKKRSRGSMVVVAVVAEVMILTTNNDMVNMKARGASIHQTPTGNSNTDVRLMVTRKDLVADRDLTKVEKTLVDGRTRVLINSEAREKIRMSQDPVSDNTKVVNNSEGQERILMSQDLADRRHLVRVVLDKSREASEEASAEVDLNSKAVNNMAKGINSSSSSPNTVNASSHRTTMVEATENKCRVASTSMKSSHPDSMARAAAAATVEAMVEAVVEDGERDREPGMKNHMYYRQAVR